MIDTVTVIIPTLCKSMDIMDYTLKELQESESVKSILIFDNTLGQFRSSLSKVQIFNSENLHCNPAWNRGVELTQTPYFLLLNDDVICSKHTINACAKILSENEEMNLLTVTTVSDIIEKGAHQYFEECSAQESKEPEFSIQGTKHSFYLFYGWYIFGRKVAWEPLPTELKIFYGDNLTYFRQDTIEPKIGFLHNYTIYHRVSTTVRSNQAHYDRLLGQEKPYYDVALKAARDAQKERGV